MELYPANKTNKNVQSLDSCGLRKEENEEEEGGCHADAVQSLEISAELLCSGSDGVGRGDNGFHLAVF